MWSRLYRVWVSSNSSGTRGGGSGTLLICLGPSQDVVNVTHNQINSNCMWGKSNCIKMPLVHCASCHTCILHSTRNYNISILLGLQQHYIYIYIYNESHARTHTPCRVKHQPPFHTHTHTHTSHWTLTGNVNSSNDGLTNFMYWFNTCSRLRPLSWISLSTINMIEYTSWRKEQQKTQTQKDSVKTVWH